jgi:hypothetical protein
MTENYILKQVFKDCWKDFLVQYPNIPNYIPKVVKKMLSCRDRNALGYQKYVCPEHPEKFVVVPHSCKSGFCNACCKQLADAWIERARSWLPDCWYWHITFTIPLELRVYFLFLPQLKEIFFQTGKEVLLGWFRERKSLPALVVAFHNHGRDLKFHPHLHCVLSCGGIDLETKVVWKECGFLPFQMLRERWKVKFLLALKGIADEELRQQLFQINWYVNVSLQRMSTQGTLHYIGRYAQRPIVSEKRIVGYDGKFVTLWYDDFRTKSPVKWTLPVFDFISLLIQHIPQPGFRKIRCYGLLANRKKWFWQAILERIGLKRRVRTRKLLTWRERQTKWLKRDPLSCPVCSKEMVLVEVAYPNILGQLTVFFSN